MSVRLCTTVLSRRNVFHRRRTQRFVLTATTRKDKETLQSIRMFRFCTFCKRSYHGVNDCKITYEDHERIAQEYMNADARRKVILKVRYGPQTLKKLMRDVDELKKSELRSARWLRRRAKHCPSCAVITYVSAAVVRKNN